MIVFWYFIQGETGIDGEAGTCGPYGNKASLKDKKHCIFYVSVSLIFLAVRCWRYEIFLGVGLLKMFSVGHIL